ncbi:MAG: FAD-dependent oxidoreductase [Phycisphaerae bacterium]|nr:FAD-dependent oxidoreductase [Phycisphaerae bacterium]
MRDVDLTSAAMAKLTGTTELLDREWAPCRNACPVHADVRAYLEAAAAGDFVAAAEIIRRDIPFASICGRICHHPCEQNCRRADVEGAVAIREVKRFVVEGLGASAPVHKAILQNKAAVAIVGAGPAGLAAALDLAKLGYRPTVFEKFPVAGGIPRTAIPKYRLPADVVKQDVDWIAAHGVTIVTGVEIGKDKTIADLQKQFAAVLVTTGLAKSRTLPLPGADHPRVLPVLTFLEAVAFDQPLDIGKNVLVIGGGNVAVDAARSAVRLGARVQMMMLEDEQEMPAWWWEQHEAKDEGVTFIHRRGPVEIVVKGGKITGLKHRKVTRVFDEAKKFSPTYDDADQAVAACDAVILAIGQMPDLGFLAGCDVKPDANGRVLFGINKATHETAVAGVFAAGEIVTPPGSAVEACASGQRAAKAIDMFLSGKPIVLNDATPPYIGTIDAQTADKLIRCDRNPTPTEPADVRAKNWNEFEHTFPEPTALAEARRCMSCGSGAEVVVDKCAACQTCFRVCPFDIPKVTDVARIDSALCQACGLCMAACPANAIVPKGYEPHALRDRVKSAVGKLPAGKKVVAFINGFHADAASWTGKADPAPAGVAEIYLSSISRLGPAEILAAIEAGATGVLVVTEPAGADRYPTTMRKAHAYVTRVRTMLKEIGLNPDRAQLAVRTAANRAVVVAAERDCMNSLIR